MRARVLTMGALIVIAGCSATVRPSSSPALPAVPSTHARPTAFEPSPTIAPSERELSDRFWGEVTVYHFGTTGFRSLDEVVAESDLIVRGRIAGRTTTSCAANASPLPGIPDPCEGFREPFAIVAVDSVLKTDGRHAGPTVMVKLRGLSDIADGDLPRGELVLFLENYGQFYTNEGYPTPSESPRWRWYYLNNGYQGALRNLGGVVDVPDAPEGWWDDYGPFPSDIDGQPFEPVIERIRALVGS